MVRKLNIVNIGGSNGIGKSTRMNVLVNYMEENYGKTDFEYDITKGKDPKIIHKIVGFTSNGYLFIGGKTQKGGWVGWDKADFSSWGKRIALYKDIYDNYSDIHTIVVEGYFNNRSAQGSPKAIRAGVSENAVSKNYVFLYDDIQEYIDRTNGRTGKDRGIEWAEKSSGWNDNAVFERFSKVYLEENIGEDTCTVLNKDEPKDYFVKEFFGESVEVQEYKQPPVAEDW
jgi:hypothetical protein